MGDPDPTEATHDALAALREIAPFDRIDPEILSRSIPAARIRRLAQGEVLLEPRMGPPDTFFVL
ncbi:MAG: hypothetical protein ACOCPR_04540, partial [Guyparkeria sp.]